MLKNLVLSPLATLLLIPFANAGPIILDFANGEPAASLAVVSKLTDQTVLDFSTGTMTVVMESQGDGVVIDPIPFNPVCIQYRDLSLLGLASNPVEFVLQFGQNSDVISTKIGGVERTVPGLPIPFIDAEISIFENDELKNREILVGVRPASIRTLQIDWLIGDRAQIEVEFLESGGFLRERTFTFASRFTHDPDKEVLYKIRNPGVEDPTVSIGEIRMTPIHVSEPGSLPLMALGVVFILAFSFFGRSTVRASAVCVPSCRGPEAVAWCPAHGGS